MRCFLVVRCRYLLRSLGCEHLFSLIIYPVTIMICWIYLAAYNISRWVSTSWPFLVFMGVANCKSSIFLDYHCWRRISVRILVRTIFKFLIKVLIEEEWSLLSFITTMNPIYRDFWPLIIWKTLRRSKMSNSIII